MNKAQIEAFKSVGYEKYKQGSYLKQEYDIVLDDGTEIHWTWPNAGSFHGMNAVQGSWHEKRVLMVRKHEVEPVENVVMKINGNETPETLEATLDLCEKRKMKIYDPTVDMVGLITVDRYRRIIKLRKEAQDLRDRRRQKRLQNFPKL